MTSDRPTGVTGADQTNFVQNHCRVGQGATEQLATMTDSSQCSVPDAQTVTFTQP